MKTNTMYLVLNIKQINDLAREAKALTKALHGSVSPLNTVVLTIETAGHNHPTQLRSASIILCVAGTSVEKAVKL